MCHSTLLPCRAAGETCSCPRAAGIVKASLAVVLNGQQIEKISGVLCLHRQAVAFDNNPNVVGSFCSSSAAKLSLCPVPLSWCRWHWLHQPALGSMGSHHAHAGVGHWEDLGLLMVKCVPLAAASPLCSFHCSRSVWFPASSLQSYRVLHSSVPGIDVLS